MTYDILIVNERHIPIAILVYLISVLDVKQGVKKL